MLKRLMLALTDLIVSERPHSIIGVRLIQQAICRRKLWQRLWDRDGGDPPGGISRLNMTMGVRFGKLVGTEVKP